jgi:hypothetical protein
MQMDSELCQFLEGIDQEIEALDKELDELEKEAAGINAPLVTPFGNYDIEVGFEAGEGCYGTAIRPSDNKTMKG